VFLFWIHAVGLQWSDAVQNQFLPTKFIWKFTDYVIRPNEGTDTPPLCINFMRFFSKNVTKEAPGKNVIFVFHVYNICFQSLIWKYINNTLVYSFYVNREWKCTLAALICALKPKLVWIIFKNAVRTSKRTQPVTITNISLLTCSRIQSMFTLRIIREP
jgi:hypothetical protein